MHLKLDETLQVTNVNKDIVNKVYSLKQITK